jgi:hypothetical protein
LAAVARDALAQQDSGDGDPRRTVVLYECRHCERVELDTGAAPMELSPGEAASLGCGANVLDLRIAGRVVKRGGPLPTSVRNAVLARDRCRCRVPGCNRRRYVHVHHLEQQARGGEHSRRNCATLCSLHHARLHDGKLRIEGDGDAELRVYDDTGALMLDPHRQPCVGATTSRVTQGGSRHPELETAELDTAAHTLLTIMAGRGGWHADALVHASGLACPEGARALTRLELGRRVSHDWGLFSPC